LAYKKETMSNKPSFFLRLIQAIAHEIWAVLFILSALALIFMAHHYWQDLLDGYQVAHNFCLKIVHLIRS
jgi:hypothetical protein